MFGDVWHATGVRIPSRDGTEIAVHDLGGDGPALLLAHATGFLAGVYRPLADELAGRFRIWALDFRSHGDSAKSDDLSWPRMAEDVAAVVDALGRERPFGFGHSMGGAALTMAELAAPGTFRALYLYEPVLFPAGTLPVSVAEGENPMAEGARRRRATFESRDAAYENYAGKPPLDALRPDALRLYVDEGFAEVEGGVTLKCTPDDEAATFNGAGLHDVFDELGRLTLPVTVAQGAVTDPGPGFLAPAQAAAIPGGRHVVVEGLGHFGPVEDPALVARSVLDALFGS